MFKEEIDIDEHLSTLWSQIYATIVHLVNSRNLQDIEIVLKEKGYVETLLVTYDGVIKISDIYGHFDDVENFDDDMLYESYHRLLSTLK